MDQFIELLQKYHLIGWLLLIGFVSLKLRIANEHQRFAIFSLGKFKGFRGPGLQFKWSGAETKWIRINLGDRGQIVSAGLMRVGESEVPVQVAGSPQLGAIVRISGFQKSSSGTVVLAELDLNQKRSVHCEKCGHEMKI